ncbi:WhiB family transcriptional regulator [Streptomyces longwoodensis]|uniref:WhiB family transcriptional regulator n=1 Tax=Streptomyces longwoodensis TaxID=68231 RepID=UPI00082DC479|nr:WhiB family transcriptional regulator [Streptomyces longwoodensis]
MHRPSRYAPKTLPRAPHWSDQGACRDAEDITVFFPEDFPTGVAVLLVKEAKRICVGCPVIEACLNAAMSGPEQYGVWGGLDAKERQLMRRREQRRRRRETARRLNALRREAGHAASEVAGVG